MILDTLFTTGQAACALLVLYGGFLVLMPARKAPLLDAKPEDPRLDLGHLHMDA